MEKAFRDVFYDFYQEAKEKALSQLKEAKTEKERAYYQRIADYMEARQRIQGGRLQ